MQQVIADGRRSVLRRRLVGGGTAIVAIVAVAALAVQATGAGTVTAQPGDASLAVLTSESGSDATLGVLMALDDSDMVSVPTGRPSKIDDMKGQCGTAKGKRPSLELSSAQPKDEIEQWYSATVACLLATALSKPELKATGMYQPTVSLSGDKVTVLAFVAIDSTAKVTISGFAHEESGAASGGSDPSYPADPFITTGYMMTSVEISPTSQAELANATGACEVMSTPDEQGKTCTQSAGSAGETILLTTRTDGQSGDTLSTGFGSSVSVFSGGTRLTARDCMLVVDVSSVPGVRTSEGPVRIGDLDRMTLSGDTFQSAKLVEVLTTPELALF
ncbi:MAG: hypothetical protein JXA67_09235 [Micromonosporaceae bacterium]|nr:hypothetical protein [Micromonosporaceae bacterium]